MSNAFFIFYYKILVIKIFKYKFLSWYIKLKKKNHLDYTLGCDNLTYFINYIFYLKKLYISYITPYSKTFKYYNIMIIMYNIRLRKYDMICYCVAVTR